MPKPAFTLTSQITGTAYQIYLRVPRTSRGPLPVVFFMDGDDQFSYGVAAYEALHRARKVPPLLLVGVGYGASYTKPANKRGRDYTPTAHSDEPSSGGGDAFLKFLSDELIPEIARRHRIREDARAIAGHSLGSLLVLHALFHEPLVFTHYLASAPSIWWAERSILKLAAARRKRSPMLPAQLFLSCGADDTESMNADLTLLEKQLAAHPFRKLSMISHRFPNRDHYNVLKDAFQMGLEEFFGKDRK